MIRLLCVEDDPVVRRYLVTRLAAEPDIRVVGAVPDVSQAEAFLSRGEIDVVILDYRLQGEDGICLAEALSPSQCWLRVDTRHPKILFCTGFADADFRARVRHLGAHGVVAKERVRTDLIPAVRTVANGGYWFDHKAPCPA
jgi:DNA-binding NarL/FixJ family response regulator